MKCTKNNISLKVISGFLIVMTICYGIPISAFAANDDSGKLLAGVLGFMLGGFLNAAAAAETYGAVCAYCNATFSVTRNQVNSFNYATCPYCRNNQLMREATTRYTYAIQEKSRAGSSVGICGSCHRMFQIDDPSSVNVICPYCKYVESSSASMNRYGQAHYQPLGTALKQNVSVKSKDLTTKEILENNINTGVTIISFGYDGKLNGSGSGFIIDPEGIILTNYHVIENAHSLAVYHKGNVYDKVALVNHDKDRDIAALKIDANGLPRVILADSSKVEQGDKVAVIGSPQMLPNTVSDGIVSAVRSFNNMKFFQITAPISAGSSGGGVFNTSGKVVGIASSGIVDPAAQNINFAIPINDTIPLIYNKFPTYVYPKAESIDQFQAGIYQLKYYIVLGYIFVTQVALPYIIISIILLSILSFVFFRKNIFWLLKIRKRAIHKGAHGIEKQAHIKRSFSQKLKAIFMMPNSKAVFKACALIVFLMALYDFIALAIISSGWVQGSYNTASLVFEGVAGIVCAFFLLKYNKWARIIVVGYYFWLLVSSLPGYLSDKNPIALANITVSSIILLLLFGHGGRRKAVLLGTVGAIIYFFIISNQAFSLYSNYQSNRKFEWLLKTLNHKEYVSYTLKSMFVMPNDNWIALSKENYLSEFPELFDGDYEAVFIRRDAKVLCKFSVQTVIGYGNVFTIKDIEETVKTNLKNKYENIKLVSEVEINEDNISGFRVNFIEPNQRRHQLTYLIINKEYGCQFLLFSRESDVNFDEVIKDVDKIINSSLLLKNVNLSDSSA